MELGLVIVRSAVTVAMFVLFILLCAWACSPRRRTEFEKAARLPLEGAEVAEDAPRPSKGPQ